MANILCLETATTNCSVSLFVEGALRALREDNSSGYSHAEKLHVFIDQILKESNIEVSDLDAVAVSKGPGSYTGLRIGVSAAKGLCFSKDLKLISIPTLLALANQLNGVDGTIIPMLDARRMEVYSVVLDAEFNEVRETKAEVLSRDSYIEYLDTGKVHFIGNGVAKFQEVCNHPNALFYPESLPSSKEMGAIANDKYKISDIEDVAYFEPYYLKDFIAG